MSRYVVETSIAQVIDDPTVTTAEQAQINAEANLTFPVQNTIKASGITSSVVRSAQSETNASLVSKIHGGLAG